MKIKTVSIELTHEELESIHYILQVGVAHMRRNLKSKDKSVKRIAEDTKVWQDKAEEIRKQLPIWVNMKRD